MFDRDASYLLADILADDGARAASFGLDSYLRFEFPVAIKTGTSSDYRGNCTLGFTPEFTVGVWVGNPDGSPMQGVTGVTGAAPFLHEVFEHLRQRFGTSCYKPSVRIQSYAVDPFTGRLAPPECVYSVNKKCLTSPPPVLLSDYDSNGRVLLQPVYHEWLASAQNALGSLVAAGEDKMTGLQILQPQPGSVYYLDGDAPVESQWIALKATGSEGGGRVLIWECLSAPVKSGSGGSRLQLSEVWHTIAVRDPVSGREASTWIEVRRWKRNGARLLSGHRGRELTQSGDPVCCGCTFA